LVEQATVVELAAGEANSVEDVVVAGAVWALD
jgi:hypothetical protein